MLKVMNNRFNSLIIVVVLIFQSMAGAFAAPLTEIYGYENCVQGMTVFMTEQNAIFQGFLDKHFKSDKLNSALVDQAVDGYKALRTEAYDEFAKYKAGNQSTTDQLSQLDACIRITETMVLQAKDMLKNHVRTTTLFKTSSILLDKYKSINSKLADLNFLIAQIVSAFATFNNRIVCFIDNCFMSD